MNYSVVELEFLLVPPFFPPHKTRRQSDWQHGAVFRLPAREGGLHLRRGTERLSGERCALGAQSGLLPGPGRESVRAAPVERERECRVADAREGAGILLCVRVSTCSYVRTPNSGIYTVHVFWPSLHVCLEQEGRKKGGREGG